MTGGAATNTWQTVAAETARRKDAPPPMWGHAVAAAQGCIWVAGGRTKGLKARLQRRTFCLDTGALRLGTQPQASPLFFARPP